MGSSFTAGTHELSVSYAGDGNNIDRSVMLSRSIAPVNRAIAFGSPPSVLYQGRAVLAGAGGASGNPVIFSSTSPGLCTVSGASVADINAVS